MKVLIISPEKPYTGAESIVTGKLMKVMIELGWKVNWIYHDKELIYAFKTDSFSILSYTIGLKNRRLERLNSFWGVGKIKSVLNLIDSLLWVAKAFFVAHKSNKKTKYDLIISRIMPRYGHLPALILKLINPRTLWIANWSDPLPGIKLPWPYGEGINAKASVLEMLYITKVFKYADWHSFPSTRLIEYFRNYIFGLNNNDSVPISVSGVAGLHRSFTS